MSGTDRIARLRALKRGLPADLGAAAPVLRRKVEADEAGRHPDLDESDRRELQRLLGMLEVAFLAAAADGELGEGEVLNLAGNLASWLGADLEAETVAAVLDSFAAAVEEDGLEARLAALASALDPDSRRVGYALASAVVACDMDVRDEELGVLGDIAGAFDIPAPEAQATFDDIFGGMQSAVAASP